VRIVALVYASEMKLLIVDDSARFRALVRSSLAGLRAEVEECSDGDQAFSISAHSQPDIILMDIRMERVNGLTATRMIKTQYRNAKVIIVTAFDDEDLRQAAREAGASGYVLKDDLGGLLQLILAISSNSGS
jgi:CheY-like chemotaxis protein